MTTDAEPDPASIAGGLGARRAGYPLGGGSARGKARSHPDHIRDVGGCGALRPVPPPRRTHAGSPGTPPSKEANPTTNMIAVRRRRHTRAGCAARLSFVFRLSSFVGVLIPQ